MSFLNRLPGAISGDNRPIIRICPFIPAESSFSTETLYKLNFSSSETPKKRISCFNWLYHLLLNVVTSQESFLLFRRLIMSKQPISIAVLLTLALMVFGSPTLHAQFAETTLNSLYRRNSAARYSIEGVQQRNINSAVKPTGVAGVNRQTYAPTSPGGLSQKRKPFSGIDRGPAVSPYLSLTNAANSPFASTSNDYYNIVRPQQQQERINQRVAKQQYMQQKQLNQVAAQGPYSIKGDDELAPTGHGSGFMQFGAYLNTGNYFAPPTQPKQQR